METNEALRKFNERAKALDLPEYWHMGGPVICIGNTMDTGWQMQNSLAYSQHLHFQAYRNQLNGISQLAYPGLSDILR